MFFFIDKKLQKLIIFAPENVKKKLQEYFDSDPDFKEAFKRDEEMLENFTDDNYIPESPRQVYDQARAQLLPGKLPFPLDWCNSGEIGKYLSTELKQSYLKGGSKGRFIFGREESKPEWWPDYLIEWKLLKNFKSKQSGSLTEGEGLTTKLRIIIRIYQAQFNIMTDNHYDQNYGLKVMKRREKKIINNRNIIVETIGTLLWTQ